MRVVECPYCGELESGADDAELVRCLVRHFEAEHPDATEADAEERVSARAYEATDS